MVFEPLTNSVAGRPAAAAAAATSTEVMTRLAMKFATSFRKSATPITPEFLR
jgi:hypothetical protein